MTTTTENPHVRAACDALGGVSATARRLNVGRESVHRWLKSGMGRARTETTLMLADLTGCGVRVLAEKPATR